MDYFAQIELGLRIKMLRTEKGLTQEKLAEALGVSLEHIGKIEDSIPNFVETSNKV